MRDIYRTLTSAGVLFVASIAAVISFEHISSLSLKYGQPALAAYLMPLSVDGLVTVSSLAMLRSARAGLDYPWMARTGLILGVLATLAANVTSGLPHGTVGAIIAGWPAIAFVISAEIAIGMVRNKPAETETGPLPDPIVAMSKRLAKSSRQNAIAIANPNATLAELATMLGTSERTARRVRDRNRPLLPSSNGHNDRVRVAV